MGVPKPGCFETGCVQFLRGSALLRSFADLRLRSIARRRANVQQLTCNIDLSKSFYCLLFSFVLIELKPLF